MQPKILLINPPIYDFSAYDFWLKPYGLLQVAGLLRSFANLSLFDYLDRLHPAFAPSGRIKTDTYGQGPYPQQQIPKPDVLKDIPRYYRRFGIDRTVFQKFLSEQGPFDAALIQTMMTYWYPGAKEVIEDGRCISPDAKIDLGGFYATACPEHARTLDPDAVVVGSDLTPLWQVLRERPTLGWQPPAWDLYPLLRTAAIKLTTGCPFKCSYCFVPQSGQTFGVRPMGECIEEIKHLVRLGVENIAFYDDALLYQPQQAIFPFLRHVIESGIRVNFHTPNALHARFLTAETAELMVRSGFKTFYLGYESSAEAFHKAAGTLKVVSDDLERAVRYLHNAGVNPNAICAYEILGHPRTDIQQLNDSMKFAHTLGIRVMLSDFSPIPGTPDGELCRAYTDLDEPLNHNKTAFPVRFLGKEKINCYKQLCRNLNNLPAKYS